MFLRENIKKRFRWPVECRGNVQENSGLKKTKSPQVESGS